MGPGTCMSFRCILTLRRHHHAFRVRVGHEALDLVPACRLGSYFPTGRGVWTIWIITLFATISVISGLSLGIKILSNIAFYLGCLILFLCFTMEKTYYLLNLIVQTAGTYMQWNIFQMPFWTDAFGALKSGVPTSSSSDLRVWPLHAFGSYGARRHNAQREARHPLRATQHDVLWGNA